MPSSANNLKKCPFCSGEGKHVYESHSRLHWIECTNCDYRTPSYVDHFSENDPESILTVMNYWNHGVKYR